MSKPLIYLASPYSHANPDVMKARFDAVCAAAAKLMAAGHLIFSPIAHTHPIGLAGKLPTNWDFWRVYDEKILDACGELWVLCLDGWTESVGIAAEVRYMTQLGRPISRLYPDDETPANGLPVSYVCRVLNEQACFLCERLECVDNTSPAALAAEAAMGEQ